MNNLSDGYVSVLDHGFVGLVDSMGTDDSIVQAARVSYGKGTKKSSEDKALIRYLLRHKHTTPFEMVDFKFHCKMPIFIARQWVRHRTASINEMSARYSELPEEFYVPKPEQMQPQSTTNKQGREDIPLIPISVMDTRVDIENHSSQAFDFYHDMLAGRNALVDMEGNPIGLSRELARIVLPLNTYTEWYWKINLHNLFNFLRLRMDHHAQWEIREYANAIYTLIQPICPVACQAFEDYILNAVTFSKQEYEILLNLIDRKRLRDMLVDLPLSKREVIEFLSKLQEKQKD